MNGLKYREILTKNRELGASLNTPVFRIALISNIVINQLSDFLEYILRQQGINAQVSVGEYDNIVQNSISLNDMDTVVVFWEPANFIEGLPAKIESMSDVDRDALAGCVEREIELVLSNLKFVPLVLFNQFSSTIFTATELRDGALSKLCKRLNKTIEKSILPNQIPVDLDKILATVGLAAAVDFRQYQISKSLYTINFLKTYVQNVQPAFRAITGRSHKVLVLDCDNTLWGGILGEDGQEGIQMSTQTHSGAIFNEVQHIIRGLQKHGVLIALCSKNNSEDVDCVLGSHPDCVLRDVDLVAKKVNWLDKATNLRELSKELNLGLDSFIFVDDSHFELGLISKELPQVKCVQVPGNLSNYPSLMRNLAANFFNLVLTTNEDAKKTEMYRDESERKSKLNQFTSIEDYLKSLGLRVNLLWDKSVHVPRVAQMTQKTNQFNLTTRRYTEGDIQRMLTNENFLLAAFSVTDQYGDYGITGMAIMRLEKQIAIIDTLLMSCRVIGRNIEYIFFDRLIDRLLALNIIELQAEYIATPKNSQVSNYYDQVGMSRIKSNSERHEYLIKLADYNKSGINYIDSTEG